MDTRQPTLLDRYALHGEIASGGMASVHVARLIGSVGFSRTVAIKRLHPQYARDPAFAAMFLEEARLVSRIRHPNVIPTLDVVAKAGELFIVMEYVAGESLSRLLATHAARGSVPPAHVAAAVMSGVLHGLHAAHEARSEGGDPLQIVHRDVSPQNVLVGLDGVPFVLDFGIARATGDPFAMREERLKGKLPYMAPEQLAGVSIDRRTDIYAASVVLWEMLTGRRLFAAPTDDALIHRIRAGNLEAPSRYAEVGAELDRIVMQGLHTNPDARFATAREMAASLERAEKLATSLEVASWVDDLAGETIRRRGEIVAAIERPDGPLTSPSGTQELEPTRLMGSAVPTEGVTSEIEAPTREIAALVRAHDATPGGMGSIRRREALHPERHASRWLVLAGLAALVMLAALVTVTRTRREPVATAATRSDTPPPIVAPSSAPLARDAAPSIPTVVPLPEVEVSSTPRAAKPVHSPCDPPYFVDAHGIRRIKRQCVPN